MRYIRMYMGSEHGAPGLTLYEIDDSGWVHRQVQIFAEGSRFSPEDILMRRPVNAEYMATHTSSEEIDLREFEMLWTEVNDSRRFCERIPDLNQSWEGFIDHLDGPRQIRWIPTGQTELELPWRRIPGFVRLFVLNREEDSDLSWATQRDIFLEREIHWRCIDSKQAA